MKKEAKKPKSWVAEMNRRIRKERSEKGLLGIRFCLGPEADKMSLEDIAHFYCRMDDAFARGEYTTLTMNSPAQAARSSA